MGWTAEMPVDSSDFIVTAIKRCIGLRTDFANVCEKKVATHHFSKPLSSSKIKIETL